MLRGSQKQMIVVRTKDSRMFEEAYFVMRQGAGRTEADETDMLWEANRIIESSLPPAARSERAVEGVPRTEARFHLFAGLVWFAMGVLCGGGLVGLLWLLL